MLLFIRQLVVCVGISGLCLASDEAPGGSSDLTLYDGRILRAARIVTIGEAEATVVHTGGVETVRVDLVPLDVLARAYERVQARRETGAALAAELQQQDDALRSSRANLAALENWGRRKALNGGMALAATGDPAPKSRIDEACVTVTTADGTGTAFILRQKGDRFVLVSNQHVVSGRTPYRYEKVDGTLLNPTNGVIARDRDILSFDLPDRQPFYFEMEPDVGSVELGEEVVIYGNSLGRGIRISTANLLAKSPTTLEVSGGIVSGNSGGPIIRKKTGRVIGVSTFVIVRSSGGNTVREIVAAAALPKLQFYGVRIDRLADVADFDINLFLTELNALEIQRRNQERAVSLLVLMAQRLRHGLDDRMAAVAKKADPRARNAVAMLNESKFYPGTFNAVDLRAFRRVADGFFAVAAVPQTYIHREDFDHLQAERAALLRVYQDLLNTMKVR